MGNSTLILRKILIIILCIILIVSFCSAIYLSINMNKWSSADLEKLENYKQTSIIYDYNDNPIADIHSIENRIKVPLKNIPQHVRDAFISVEDVRFYKHHGIDIKRIFGAFLQDIKHRGYVQGASTITQQVARNGFLSQKKTINRKIQEIFLAYQLEKKYSKDQILEMYLNLIYFGSGTYGVEAASKIYFNKSVKELSIGEAALLAGIPKNPAKYSPFYDKKSSFERKNLVIDLMVKNNVLTDGQGRIAKEENIDIATDFSVSNYPYGFFIDMVLGEAADKLKIKDQEIFTKGYRIYTTLDTDLQKYSEQLYKDDSLFPKNPYSGETCESALVILDAHSGELRTILGGRKYPKDKRKVLNRAIHARRQPGSTIKPLISYIPAIENFNYTPVTFIDDAPVRFGNYVPSNFDGKFRGPITLRSAVSNSINIPAVKVLSDIGIQNGITSAERFGIPFSKEDYNNLSISLGGFYKGVTPMEMARAYMALANKGIYKEVSVIRRIENSNSIPIYEFNQTAQQIITEETAFIMNNILQSTVKSGTARKLSSLALPLAAKTGTAQLPNTKEFKGLNGIKDSWVVAYNPDYIVSVWMGFDITDKKHFLPTNAVGGNQPTQIAKNIFEYISSKVKLNNFIKPVKVKEVKLDAKALEEDKKVLLATNFTPPEYVITEYFKSNNIPKESSTYWSIPEAPDDFDVIKDEKGFPVIQLSARQSFIRYDIYRIDTATQQTVMINSLHGKFSEKIQWTDNNIESSKKYGYFIIPVHTDILDNGKPLQGISTNTIWVDTNEKILHENKKNNTGDNRSKNENENTIDLQLTE